MAIARERTVVSRALVAALVVGTILTVVNHGGEILREGALPGLVPQIGLTLLVPYVVSTVSSVLATEQGRASAAREIDAVTDAGSPCGPQTRELG